MEMTIHGCIPVLSASASITSFVLSTTACDVVPSEDVEVAGSGVVPSNLTVVFVAGGMLVALLSAGTGAGGAPSIAASRFISLSIDA
jgi:hypothetical protein